MGKRFVTIDTGEAKNAVFTLETDATPAELIALASKLGYLALPAGAACRQGETETRLPVGVYVLFSRFVEMR